MNNYNGGCIDLDGSVLPANMTVTQDRYLGVVVEIKDYHGNVCSFITSEADLDIIGLSLQIKKTTELGWA